MRYWASAPPTRTGEIETRDGQFLIGSAKRALSADKKFDRYFFIENDKKKVAELCKMVNTEFPDLKEIVKIYCGDANEKIEQILRDLNWRYNRGLLFLDPYATEVNWTTLETVAKTKSIDVWYLFPFSALNRMLPKNGKYKMWKDCIDRLLGDSGWQTEFYMDDPQKLLWDLLPDSEAFDSDPRKIKVNPERIKAYIISRLETIFPCVSKHPKIFRNSKNSPLFLFFFAISNESEKAQNIALRMADHILLH